MSGKIKSLQHLCFSIGGFRATHFEVELSENMLRYSTWDYFPNDEPHIRELSRAERIHFVQALNTSGLPDWTFVEPDHFVHDGTQWELYIRYNGNLRKRYSESNRYPNPEPEQDPMDYSLCFRTFLKAIRALIPEWELGP